MSSFSETEETGPDRRNVIKMALIYTPIAVFSLILCTIAIYNIAGGEPGFYFTLVIFGILGLLTGSQAILYLRDLTVHPIEFQGEVVRKWHKGNLLFFFLPSYYITVDSKIFQGRIDRVEDNGAFIRLESGVEGFVPRKEIDSAKAKARSARDMVNPGDTVSYKVTGVDRHGVYKLSCRKAEERSIVGKIFVISRVEYAMLLELDLVKVTCYPHSATVERLERYDESEKRFIPATTGATF
jgi:S1 RNA binding domain